MDTAQTNPDLMTVGEVAQYLRVKDRTVYHLVRTNRIPFCRLSGKLLFPRRLVDQWLADSAEHAGTRAAPAPAPPVVAGSHDPLLEWALRESGCGLAMLASGSVDGVQRLAGAQAIACGLHVRGAEPSTYNVDFVASRLRGSDFVMSEWARREQGLVVARKNPLRIAAVSDLVRRRVALRQEGSGSQMLLDALLAEAGLSAEQLHPVERRAQTHTDVALMVAEGKADCGLAVRAVATQLSLDFVPLAWERFDLVIRRWDYFEPPIQRLLAFARSSALTARAQELGGYDVQQLGRIVLNPQA